MTDTIRLLQIGKHFFPDRGGIETVTMGVSETLPVHGVQADVLCTARAETYPALDTSYRVIRARPTIRFGRNKDVSLDYVRRIRALSEHYDLALIHLPNPVAAAAVLAFWQKPYILLWHADIPQRPIRLACAPLDKALIDRAAAVIAPTRGHVEGSVHAARLAPKAHEIRYPFDRDTLPAATGRSATADRAAAFLQGRRLSLSIGRLVPYKGFDVLIDAARHTHEDFAFIIAGTGPLHDALQRRIESAGLARKIWLAGPVDDAGLADLLDLATLCCMPSVTEAEMYGMVQVEAMAAGKPVVSTRLPRSGVPYINHHERTGLLVDPGDPVALAQAVNRIATDADLRCHLSEGAARAFAEEHDKAPTSRAYADLIGAVVRANGRPVAGSLPLADASQPPTPEDAAWGSARRAPS